MHNDVLNFLGKSRLNGKYCYEILLDKFNNEIVCNILKCKVKNIITDCNLIDLHLGCLIKNSYNLPDPYSYKIYYT